MFAYHAFGLRLASNRRIGGLLRYSNPDNCDLHVCWGEKPSWLKRGSGLVFTDRYISDTITETGNALLTVRQLNEDGKFWFIYHDGTQFAIDLPTGQIWSFWPIELTLEDAATYFLGPILGFLLRLRDVVCLHGSAVAVEDHAIALVGPAYSGKSTTAAAFARNGYSVLSDDILPIFDMRGHFRVQPGYPRVRLWSDSTEMLFGDAQRLPLITPNWDKRFLDLTEDRYQFQQKPLYLSDIYLLDKRIDHHSGPRVETLPPTEALVSLIANSYSNYLLDREMRAREFEFLAELVGKVPVKRIIPFRDPRRISELCDLILEDVHSERVRSETISS